MSKGKWLDELDDALDKLKTVTAERDRLREAIEAYLGALESTGSVRMSVLEDALEDEG